MFTVIAALLLIGLIYLIFRKGLSGRRRGLRGDAPMRKCKTDKFPRKID